MKIYPKYGALLLITILISVFFIVSADSVENQKSKMKIQESSKATSQIAQGRYLVMMIGCNDCHTHGYMQLEGKVPEPDWLTGESVGWYGPWGTTYATNLRLFLQNVSEDVWVKYSRAVKLRPAMPWWVLHEMKEQDLRAIHRFIKNLGQKGENAPEYLPPNRRPKPPYFEFFPQVTK